MHGRPQWSTRFAETRVKRDWGLEPDGPSMFLLLSFRDVLNCGKATLPLGSHRAIQCAWLLGLRASVLGPFIRNDGVHLTAE